MRKSKGRIVDWAKRPVYDILDDIVIEAYPHKKVPSHTFIMTTKIHDKSGFIYSYGNEFALCLSSNNSVRMDARCGKLFGFYRNTFEEIRKLVSSFALAPRVCDFGKNRYEKDTEFSTAEPLIYDTSVLWMNRIKGHKLENVDTGEVYELTGKHRCKVVEELKLGNKHLEKILYYRGICEGWQLMTTSS